MEYGQKNIVYLSGSWYNINKANRILEYPGQRQARRKPYIRRGKVSFGMESFHAFFYLPEDSLLWRKNRRKL